MDAEPEVPPALCSALVNLDGLVGAQVLDGWWWHGTSQEWAFRCRLQADVLPGGPVPKCTDWYVLVTPNYPRGTVRFHPARDGGLSGTFPHQGHDVPNGLLPWRSGDLCLGSSVRSLGRHFPNEEPNGAAWRLRWYVLRAQSWLALASRRQLLAKGDPFELPVYWPRVKGPEIVYSEGADGFDAWMAQRCRSGLVEVFVGRGGRLYVDRFLDRGERVLAASEWGTYLSTGRGETKRAAWLMLSGVPHLPEWRGPATWGELRKAAREHGDDLDQLLRDIVKGFRDGRDHTLLLGFPIPHRVGDAPRQIHWLGVQLPALSTPARLSGFLGKNTSCYERDQQSGLRDKSTLGWLATSNWHSDEVSTRGYLPSGLRKARVCLLGAGSLGAEVGTLLVRGGVTGLVVVDRDDLEVGNLVRHPLGLNAVDRSKAMELALRLNASSAHAHVVGVHAMFPDLAPAELLLFEESDIIIDCTAADPVLEDLSAKQHDAERMFVTGSFGFGAKRLFLFAARGKTFPVEAFWEAMGPHVSADRNRTRTDDVPWQGTGCWHPVFPARGEDVVAWAAVTIRFLIYALTAETPTSFAVYEMSKNDYFQGIRLLTPQAGGF